MIQETEKPEFVEFEIVPGSEQAVWAASPWQMARFVVMGLVGLAIFMVIVAFGVFFMIPLLIFFVITRIISTLLSAGVKT